MSELAGAEKGQGSTMMKKLGLLFLVVALMGCPALAGAESADAWADVKILGEMDYMVGPEIEPGEYILLSLPGKTGFFHLAADLYDRETVAEEEFETNTIVAVEEEEYLIIGNCIGIRAEDFYAGMKIGSGQYGTMLKADYDLKPGKYKLEAAPGKVGQCRIFSSGRHRKEDLVAELAGETLSPIDVSAGQYVQLINCRVAGEDARSTYHLLNVKLAAARGEKTVVIQEGVDPAVRSTPAAKGEKIGKATSGMQYILLDSETRWYKIRLEDGTEGWIVNYYAEIVE